VVHRVTLGEQELDHRPVQVKAWSRQELLAFAENQER